MAVVIFLFCCAGGLAIFWTCVRPFTRAQGLDIATYKRHRR